MNEKRLVGWKHPLFEIKSYETPCVIQGDVGSGKSIVLTELALSYLEKGKSVLHLTNFDQNKVKKQYEQRNQSVSYRKRMLHSRHGKPLELHEVQEIIIKYESILDFYADVIIVEGLVAIDRSWLTICDKEKIVWLASEQEKIPEDFYTINLVHVGNRIELHGLDLHPLLFLNPTNSMLYSLHDKFNKNQERTLYTSGATGAEEAFGKAAEKWAISEVNYSFEGHIQSRKKHVKTLSESELSKGTVSLHYVSRKLRRSWSKTPLLKKVLQVIWHIVSNAEELFVVGTIQEDGTVHGGTGWSVELAQRWNKPTWVYDQDQEKWFIWMESEWKVGTPTIKSKCFAGSGTRFLRPAGKKAIEDLFTRSYS